MSLLVSARPASIHSQAKMLVMKAVLLPDPTDDQAVKHNKLDVEDKYTITHFLVVVLLEAHVEHMELRLADRAAFVEAPCLESLEGVAVTKALRILALPRLARPPRPAPQSWHSGGFDDKKCVNATSNN